MQAEIDTTTTAHPVRILGVNAVGQETGNAAICSGRTLPWLQDTPQADVWTAWRVNFRDLVILDTRNHVINVYNLTDHNLADSTNYATLKSMLITAARKEVPGGGPRECRGL